MKSVLLITFLLYQLIIHIEAKLFDLSEYDLCYTDGDSSNCNIACQELFNEKGNCLYNKCYCTENEEVGRCEYDDHESCDALCQDISSSFIGFCMDGQCNCLS